MSKQNIVTGPYEALTNKGSTGFAGCKASDDCPIAGRCLRADPVLVFRVAPRIDKDGKCSDFIPYSQRVDTE